MRHEPAPAPRGQRGRREVVTLREIERGSQRQRKGIARCRVEETALDPKSRHAIVRRPEHIWVTADADWQHPGFLPNFGSHDALLQRRGAHPGGDLLDIEHSRVAVVSVFHQHAIKGQRQSVDESIAIDLRHPGIHNRRAIGVRDSGPVRHSGRARRLCREFDTHEFLPAEFQPRHRPIRTA